MERGAPAVATAGVGMVIGDSIGTLRNSVEMSVTNPGSSNPNGGEALAPESGPSEGAGAYAPSSDQVVRIVETDRDVVELAASTSKGEVRVIASMTIEGETLVLKGMHIEGPGAGSLGLRELRKLATDLGRQQGAKQVTIYGGTRTTGANPGHTPRPITFAVGD